MGSRKRVRAGGQLRIESLGYGDEIVGVFPSETWMRRGKSIVAVSQRRIGDNAAITLNTDLFEPVAYHPETQVVLLYGASRLIANYAWTSVEIAVIGVPFDESSAVVSAGIRTDGFIAVAFSNSVVLVNKLDGSPFQLVPIDGVEVVGFAGQTMLAAADRVVYAVNDDLSLHKIADYSGIATSITGVDGRAVLTTDEVVLDIYLYRGRFSSFALPGARSAALGDGETVWVLHGLDGVSLINGQTVESTIQLPDMAKGTSILPLIALRQAQIRTSPGQCNQLYLLDPEDC